jgi:hypothetical protein
MSQAIIRSIEEAIQQLDAVKRDLHELANEESQLAALRSNKELLERDIAALKLEKTDLEISIHCLKQSQNSCEFEPCGADEESSKDPFAADSDSTTSDGTYGDDDSAIVFTRPVSNISFAKHLKAARKQNKSKYTYTTKKWRRMLRSHRLQSFLCN